MKHRPGKDQVITHLGADWEVLSSDKDSTQIKIKLLGGKKTEKKVEWREIPYRIKRPNTETDWDMRGKGAGADVMEAAKAKALEMMKDYILAHSDPGKGKFDLKKIAVAVFAPTGNNDPVTGAPAEWSYTWVCKDLTWTFILDMDRPLDTSDQEPHVGWTLSAVSEKGKQHGFKNVFGHVWVDDVPASRQG